MIHTRKTLVKSTLLLFLIIMILLFFVYKKWNKTINALKSNETVIENTSAPDMILVKAGDIYQKVSIPSGAISQASSIERDDLSDFGNLPEKKYNQQFYDNYSLIYSEHKDNFIAVSFLGQTENSDKQSEFTCNVVEKKCQQTKILFNDYRLQETPIDTSSFIWLNWNNKNSVIIGLKIDVTDKSTLYVCNTNKRTCIKNTQDNLNFPSGAINSDSTKIVAVKQNDISNEKTGDKWELLLYDTADLSKPIKSYDISVAIDKNEDLVYDGVSSIAWSNDNKTILFGTLRNIFKFDLENEKLEKIFTDISEGEDDLYWNSDHLKFSPSERYAIFIDTIDENLTEENATEENTSATEGILKVIDLKDNNKAMEIFQSKDLILK